jgi:geranylgeranyl reductase family protein
MKTKHDVIIVGAGPAGSYTASLLKDMVNILVLEEHESAGGKPCTGLISTNLEKFVDVKSEWVENRVKGAVIHLPSGRNIILEKSGTAAYVVDRNKFDTYLAKQVESRILFGSRAKYIRIKKNCVEIKTDKGILKSKMVIGADGINSVVRKHFRQKPGEIVNGLAAFTSEADDSEHVHIYLDKKLIKDGFFWKVPRGRRTEYGAMGTGIGFRMLEKFFGLKDCIKQSHPIPIGPGRTYFERAILIGDAAGITKPWSGGGVICGLTCSKIAAEVVLKAVEANNFSENFLGEYEILWKNQLWKNIKAGLLLRRLLKMSNNAVLEMIFSVIGKMNLNERDMDFPF